MAKKGSGGKKYLEDLMDKHSQREIAKMTGISRSTLGNIIRQDKPLNKDQQKAIKQAYHRESYKTLREAGFNTREASTRRVKAPEQVKDSVNRLSDIVDTLTDRKIQGKTKTKEEKEKLRKEILKSLMYADWWDLDDLEDIYGGG